jgi:hypothetical protein
MPVRHLNIIRQSTNKTFNPINAEKRIMLSISKDPEGCTALEVKPGGAWPLYSTPFDTDMITDQIRFRLLDIDKYGGEQEGRKENSPSEDWEEEGGLSLNGRGEIVAGRKKFETRLDRRSKCTSI